jgi:hypothetical protein
VNPGRLENPAEQSTAAGTATWLAGNGGFRVDYPVLLFESIRRKASFAMHGIGHGGIEIGGLLLGRCDGDHFELLSWRPIHCDHSRGSSFLLSDRDVATLSCQIEALGVDPVLAGQQILGWFVSHTRGTLDPRAEEAGLHARLLKRYGSLLLLLQPSRFGDAEIRFSRFQPDANEFLSFEPALHISPLAEAVEAPDPDPPAPARIPPSRQPRSWRGIVAWFVGLAGLVFVLLAVATFVRHSRTTPPAAVEASAAPGAPIAVPSSPVRLPSLDIRPSGDVLAVTWDPQSPAVKEASGAILTVFDQGQRFSRELSREELDLGRIEYTRSTAEIRVLLLLRLRDGSARTEQAHFSTQWLPGEKDLSLPKP